MIEAGAKTATERAHAIWKRKLAEFEPPLADASVAEALDDFVARRTAAPRRWIEAAAGAVSLRVVGTADACPKSNEAGDGVSAGLAA